MKTHLTILTLTLFFSSCYSYKEFNAEEYLAEKEKNNSPTIKKDVRKLTKVARGGNENTSVKNDEKAVEEPKTAPASTSTPAPIDPSTIKITEIIKEKSFYKVEVEGNYHTIEAKQWKGDTLYSIVKGKPSRELKFHQKDITNIRIRKFSKGKYNKYSLL